MAIDHGLGGRDGKKSQRRREKKAKQTKIIAKNALKRTKDGKKKEIIFDENARVDYVSNFHKRKQDRRRYGLAMEVLKKEKAHKQMRKEQRSILKTQLNELIDSRHQPQETNIIEDIGESDKEVGEGVDVDMKEEGETKQKMLSFHDESTVSMFGSVVNVIVNNDLNNNNDATDEVKDINNNYDNYDDDDDPLLKLSITKHKKLKQLNEPTRLQRALKKAKIQMSMKKNKNNSKKNSNNEKDHHQHHHQGGGGGVHSQSKYLLSKAIHRKKNDHKSLKRH